MNKNKAKKSIWDSFTNQYKIQKTLRFELKPVGETEANIKKHEIIESHWLNGINVTTGKDQQLAENYQFLKKAMNQMHQLFIQDALDFRILKNAINDKELRELHNLREGEKDGNNIIPDSETKDKKNAFASGKLKLAKKLQTAFDNVGDSWKKSALKEYREETLKFGKSGVEVIHENSDSFSILTWLVSKDEIKLEKPDESYFSKEELKELIDSFKGFHTYFSGFNQNRENIYDTKGDNGKLLKTSIAHRVFEENLDFFFTNVIRWNKILDSLKKSENAKVLKEKKWDVKAMIKLLQDALKDDKENPLLISIESAFKPESFIHFISQKGIDNYNKILGGLPAEGGKQKLQGLNEIFNLTRQQLNSEKKEFPVLQSLYKQIMSESDRNFIDAFENDHDLILEIEKFRNQLFEKKSRDQASDTKKRDFFDQVKIDLDFLLSEIKKNAESYYLTRPVIKNISSDLFGTYNAIDTVYFDEIDSMVQENGNSINKTAKEKLIRKRALTFAEVDGLIQKWIIIEPEKLKEKWSGNVTLSKYFSQTLHELFSQEMIPESPDPGLKLTAKNSELESLFQNRVFDKREDGKIAIKQFMDSALAVQRFIKDFIISPKDLSSEQESDTSSEFQNRLHHLLDQFQVIELYNKTRNYLTKKPYSTDKIKLNFENSTLAAGWDVNKETANTSVLFIKDGNYYLGIMRPEDNAIFDYHWDSGNILNQESKDSKHKVELKKQILAGKLEESYTKVNYKLLPGPNKMLPKVFFSDKNIDYYNPSQKILDIKERESFKKSAKNFILKDCHTFINFYKESLVKHPEWKSFNFEFTPTKEYEDISLFYKEVESQGYKLTFDNIKADYIDSLVKEGKLYLFQIYNKDFSPYAKGKENLHTTYWKMVFNEENLKDVVMKLNGEAELFYRPASIAEGDKITHKGGKSIENKNPDATKKHSTFDFDIVKDRRFTKNKYFFHCPVTLNFKAEGFNYLNDKVQELAYRNPEVKVIGIDRGEKHLLYYTLINQKGEILDQGSLNTIETKYISDNKEVTFETPYQKILDTKEKDRDEARKSWQNIENIKEAKAGYLSQVVHQLTQLIINHNAIVVLEDLNTGFKRGRFKVEKQVYQKFERALIEKLNYLVFKDRKMGEPGHYLKAWQLTNQFESFEKLGKQSGILFYTTAGYTSKVDPVTGYMQNLYPRYDKEKTKEFFRNFEHIKHNGKYFEFTYDLESLVKKKLISIEELPAKTEWTVCSCVERSRYDKIHKSTKLFNLNDELEALFKEYSIAFDKDKDLRNTIGDADEKFIKSLHYYFMAILNMRVTDPSIGKGEDDNDYILSPVAPFYDSRKTKENLLSLPKNGDANGAYNIARKGIIILQKNILRQKIHEQLAKEGKNNKKIVNYSSALGLIKNKSSLETLFREWLVMTGRDFEKTKTLFDGKKLSSAGAEFVKFIQGFSVTKTDWQNYAQHREVVKAQIQKMGR